MNSEIADDTCWMFLVRHGATEHNLMVPGVLQGCNVDGDLAPIGRRQAEATAQFLEPYPFDAIYASPMKRAQQTAKIIAPDRQIVTVPEIIEADVGRWVNRGWDDIAENEPEAYRLHLEDPSIHPYPGGESATDVAIRAVPVMNRLLKQHLGQRILVVSHYIVIRAIIATLYKAPLKYMREIHLGNCSVNLIRMKKDEIHLMTVNSTFHVDHVD
ncbi:hypothetical protein GC197_04505 [bacterium]|nr:hypothetical protein [bacterium]